MKCVAISEVRLHLEEHLIFRIIPCHLYTRMSLLLINLPPCKGMSKRLSMYHLARIFDSVSVTSVSLAKLAHFGAF